MLETVDFNNEDVEVWKKPKNNNKIAIVAPLPEHQQSLLVRYYSRVLQKSPLGWVPVTQNPYRYSSRILARSRIHQMGYVIKDKQA